MVKNIGRSVIVMIVLAVLACLPVIPIFTAPVVPRAVYTFKFIAFINILTHPIGIRYKWEWYTVAVALAMLAAGCMIVIVAMKRFDDFFKS